MSKGVLASTEDRGFLRNYPPDVICVINGRPITKGDILENKRRRQRRELEWKRRNWEPVIRPCFIWTFYNQGFIYGGWWLYVQTLHESFGIGRSKEMVLKIMGLFPCGYLPMVENFEVWKVEFARIYRRPTRKRPDKNGMAPAWAQLSHNGILLDVFGDHPSDPRRRL